MHRLYSTLQIEPGELLLAQHGPQLRLQLPPQLLHSTGRDIHRASARNLQLALQQIQKFRLQRVESAIARCMIDIEEIADRDFASAKGGAQLLRHRLLMRKKRTG